MREFFFNALGWLLGLTLLYGFSYAIMQLSKENESIRERQRAACVAAGGKYAISQENRNNNPARDYCIL